jgi:hypothetical protein
VTGTDSRKEASQKADNVVREGYSEAIKTSKRVQCVMQVVKKAARGDQPQEQEKKGEG